MKKYVFLSNSPKPTSEEQNSRKEIELTNVSKPCLEAAINMGFKVYFGVNRANPEGLQCELDVHLYDSHTYRSIFDFKSNYIAYKNLMSILKTGNFEVIHCNTPVGGLIGRICGKKAKVKKIIYTAHGFHFFKGAPLVNRTIFKWAEMIMAHWTDVIITMNKEDYQAASKFKLRNNGKVYYIPGVGIDTAAYKNIEIDKVSKRGKLGLELDDIVLIAMGDLIQRKNYEASLKAIAIANNPKLKFLICGRGPRLDSLQNLAKELGIENQVHFLGFRTDIKELLKISDLFLFTTYQEGLPRSMMEAMAAGLPCVASEIRGNIDLIEDGKGGYLRHPEDIVGLADVINRIANDKNLRIEMSQSNLQTIKMFDIGKIKQEINRIYDLELK